MSPISTIPLLIQRMEEKNKEWTKQKDMKEVVSLQLRKNIL